MIGKPEIYRHEKRIGLCWEFEQFLEVFSV